MRQQARTIALKVSATVQTAESTSVSIAVYPKETAWLVDGDLFQGWAERGFHVTTSRDAAYLAEFGIMEAKVEYIDPRREGWFGHRLVTRNVRLVLSVKVVDVRTGSIVLTSLYPEVSTDVIEMSEIETLETSNISATKGLLPQEGFFSNAVEPIVIIGSIAVAVFLLFTVRS